MLSRFSRSITTRFACPRLAPDRYYRPPHLQHALLLMLSRGSAHQATAMHEPEGTPNDVEFRHVLARVFQHSLTGGILANVA